MSYASVGPYTFNYSYLQTVDVIVPGSDVTCYLEFEITQAVGPGAWSDANIFMYEREPADEDGNFKSYFSNVCTPTDLEEIDDKVEPAANAPTPGTTRPSQFAARSASAVTCASAPTRRSEFTAERTLPNP